MAYRLNVEFMELFGNAGRSTTNSNKKDKNIANRSGMETSMSAGPNIMHNHSNYCVIFSLNKNYKIIINLICLIFFKYEIDILPYFSFKCKY